MNVNILNMYFNFVENIYTVIITIIMLFFQTDIFFLLPKLGYGNIFYKKMI